MVYNTNNEIKAKKTHEQRSSKTTLKYIKTIQKSINSIRQKTIMKYK